MIASGLHTKHVAISGAVLSIFYTLIITFADAITKLFASSYSAPQLFAISGGLVACFSLIANRRSGQRRSMRTNCPCAMAIRVVATIAATIAFFYAFRYLAFAEVFVFIALIPLLAALLSGPVLNERVRPASWVALLIGCIGVFCLVPSGLSELGFEHMIALFASTTGTISLVASRYIGVRDDNLLAQVFYPNLGLLVAMGVALPFVFVPMGWVDVLLAVAYASLLFLARWVLVAALVRLPTYVVTPLMNLQFIWMVVVGVVFFGEFPGLDVFFAAAVVIAAGLWLVWEQSRPSAEVPAVPAE